MTTQLIFNNTPLTIINHNNQIWFTSTELARALAYKTSDAVTRLYNRNKDKFTPSMTETVNLTASKDLQGPQDKLPSKQTTPNHLKRSIRIFSLRGAHLIAMLADTLIAKDFRKWVLDILDKQISDPEQEIKLALLNARFLASFDTNLQLQVKTIPESSYLVDTDDRDHINSFVKECVPPEFLPDVVKISLNRLSHLFKEDKLIYID